MAQERKLNVDLHLIIKKVEALTRKIVQTPTLGEYASIFRGGGFEFDGYKEYNPEIDANKIDWKASIRSKRLLVKLYREIRELQVYFILDVDDTMVFGSSEKLKNETAAEFTLALAYIILKAGDKVGLISFNDRMLKFIEPNGGTHQFYKIAQHILDPELYGGKFNLKNAAEFAINSIRRKNSVIILVSDFYGQEQKEWEQKVKSLATKFDTVAIVVRDPRDKELPEDVSMVMIEDPSSGKKMVIESELLSKKYNAYTKKQDEILFNFFSKIKIDSIEVMTNQDYMSSIIKFFGIRKRRIRYG